MEGSRRKSLSVPHTLLLLFLLISPLPSLSQAENPKCFVCSSRTSEKCEGALSSLDTEFIMECPSGVHPGTTDPLAPSGCSIFILHPVDYVHPRGRYVWRDCLYSTDFDLQLDYVSPKPPWSTGKADQKSTHVGDLNKRRQSNGLSPIASLTTEPWNTHDVQIVVQYFLHPDPEHWTLSNKAAAKILFPESYKKPSPMRSVKCFVCTHEDPGCEDELTPSNRHLIQECVGSQDTTVPIGCQILLGHFEYPHLKTYFYRDCLYQNYLYCYMNPPQSPPPLNPDPDDEWSIQFPPRLDCLNNVRSLLRLPHYDTGILPEWRAIPATLLYVVPGEPERKRNVTAERFKDRWTRASIHQADLSNGVAIAGLTKPRRPTDFKINEAFSCHHCDTQTGYCGGKKGEIMGDLPQHQCKSPHPDAYGCMMIWTEVGYGGGTGEQMPIDWQRRGCWYKGDLFCLKGLELPTSSGRSAQDCPTCDPRRLIRDGNTVYWEGVGWEYAFDERPLLKLRSCLKTVRQRMGVTESLPELPGRTDSTSFIYFSFCAGRTLCNDKQPGEIPFRNSTCDPDDEWGYPCKCEGDNCDDKKGWPTYVMVLIGIFVTFAIITGMAIGIWLWTTRRERVGPELPVDNHQAMEGGLPQVESNGSKVEAKLEGNEKVGT